MAAYGLVEGADTDEALRSYFQSNWGDKISKKPGDSSTGVFSMLAKLVRPTVTASDVAIADRISAALQPTTFESSTFAGILNSAYTEASSHLLVSAILGMADILAKRSGISLERLCPKIHAAKESARDFASRPR